MLLLNVLFELGPVLLKPILEALAILEPPKIKLVVAIPIIVRFM